MQKCAKGLIKCEQRDGKFAISDGMENELKPEAEEGRCYRASSCFVLDCISVVIVFRVLSSTTSGMQFDNRESFDHLEQVFEQPMDGAAGVGTRVLEGGLKSKTMGGTSFMIHVTMEV